MGKRDKPTVGGLEGLDENGLPVTGRHGIDRSRHHQARRMLTEDHRRNYAELRERARHHVGDAATEDEIRLAVIEDLGLTDELERRTIERRQKTARWLRGLSEEEAHERGLGDLWQGVAGAVFERDR